MLKGIVINIMAASLLAALGELLLPESPVSESAKRVMLILETAAITAPIARFIGGLL